MLKDFIVFDWEVFPKWNCMVYGKHTEKNEEFETQVITSDDTDYVEKLTAFSTSGYLTGFNIKRYDMIMLNNALSGYSPEDLYNVSMSIIHTDNKLDFSYWTHYDFCDLFDDLKMGSLKSFESNSGLAIRETNIPFGTVDLSPADKIDIIKYCNADVYATNYLLTARMGYIKAKAYCTRLSDIDEAVCIKNTAAGVLAKVTKARKTENPDLPIYEIPEKLKPEFISTIHPVILENFENLNLLDTFKFEVKYLKNDIIFGAGGIHGTYSDALYCIADDEWALFDADFQNLYPSELDEFNYYPTGMPEEGTELFKRILHMCRSLKTELKEIKGKVSVEEYAEKYDVRDSTKLLMNAATGAMRLKFSKLFDPQKVVALCITGQLLATYMAKRIHDIGGLILQLNTDGIIFKVKRIDIPKVSTIIDEISKFVNIPLDLDEEYAIFQKDVNNYIMYSTPTSKPKLKGRWAKKSGSDVPLAALNMPIINEAIIAYYKDHIDIGDTIRSCKTPLSFMATTVKGPTFDYVIYQNETGEHITTNVNRVYASTNTNFGKLFKIKLDDTGKESNRTKISSLPEHCGLWPDAVPDTGIIPDLDYDWYINEALDHVVDMQKV